MAIPTEQQIREAGERLNLVRPGEPITPRLRGKLAKVVELAEAETAAESDRATTAAAVAGPIADAYHALVERDIPDVSAARIVAALAPMIWRTNQGAAQR